MKKILIKLIDIYRMLPISTHSLCKYTPTCSEYARLAIEKYGAFRGTVLAIKRIFRCAPWGRGGYDPVPNLNKK